MEQDRKKALAQQYKARKKDGGIFKITNSETGKFMLAGDVDLTACKNRFEFSVLTDGCTYNKLAEDWKKYGGKAFSFEVLESLEKKEEQTDKEFREDVNALYELWLEKLNGGDMY